MILELEKGDVVRSTHTGKEVTLLSNPRILGSWDTKDSTWVAETRDDYEFYCNSFLLSLGKEVLVKKIR